MVMDGYRGRPDRLPELWAKINSLHLGYLEMGENPQKLGQRNRLEECIKEFLCIAPHSHKFYLKETAEVLRRSANSKKDFSGYKAAMGWNAIAVYAGNLIAQPWRQEYREIKTYSGFYKHQIEANLVGAEIMFEAMGYKHAGNGVMVLEGPICPDRVTNVSQDSLVAYVECQILKEIWEEVCAASFKVTWLEVLEFRETHLCSPQKSVDALKYQIQQRQYHEHHRSSYPQDSNDYNMVNCRYTQGRHAANPTLPTNHSFPPLIGHTHVQLPGILPAPPPCIYANGYSCGNYGMLPGHYTYPTSTYNNFYCNGYVAPQSHYGQTVPTGQLIELGSSQTCDTPDGAISKKEKPISRTKDEASGQLENWDYVYRNLESQGYSKDLGERGDILSGSCPKNEIKYDLKTIDRPLKINEALEKMRLYDSKQTEGYDPLSDAGLSSSYENISSQELKPKPNPKPKASNLASKIKAQVVEVVDTVERSTKKRNDKLKKPDSTADKWECKACTFLNDGSINICDMCGKSKVSINHDMEIGGSECSKCTLVNPKDKTVCEACGASLHNSPTYI